MAEAAGPAVLHTQQLGKCWSSGGALSHARGRVDARPRAACGRAGVACACTPPHPCRIHVRVDRFRRVLSANARACMHACVRVRPCAACLRGSNTRTRMRWASTAIARFMIRSDHHDASPWSQSSRSPDQCSGSVLLTSVHMHGVGVPWRCAPAGRAVLPAWQRRAQCPPAPPRASGAPRPRRALLKMGPPEKGAVDRLHNVMYMHITASC